MANKRRTPSPSSSSSTPTAAGAVRAVADLKADAKNPRTIKKAALKGLRVSLEDFGDLSGIVWNAKLGTLVTGHQRLTALQAAGLTEWRQVSEAEGVISHPVTNEEFRVRIVHWDEVKHRIANIAANNPQIQGEWSEEVLAQLADLEEHAHFAELRLDALADLAAAELATTAAAQEGEGSGSGTTEAPPDPNLIEAIGLSRGVWQIGESRAMGEDASPMVLTHGERRAFEAIITRYRAATGRARARRRA